MNQMMAGVNLSYIRGGAAQMGTVVYWIREHFSNQGLMSEAVGILCDFAFTTLGLHRLEAARMIDNERSARVLKRTNSKKKAVHRAILKSAVFWPTTDFSLYVAMTLPIRSLLLFLLWAGVTPASALDAISIGDDLRVMRLAPYVQSTPEGHLAFAVQNASDEPIHLDLERLRPPLMGFALGLFREQDGLRLFVSDDS